MTDLQAAKRTINMLADALWSAQTWETAEQIRRRVLAGLTDQQIEAVEDAIMASRTKRSAAVTSAAEVSEQG